MAPASPVVPRPDLDDAPSGLPGAPRLAGGACAPAQHGGGTDAWSDGSGRGSTFSFDLREAACGVSGGAPGADPRPSGEGGAHRILVVDDNEDAAESLADVLRCAGYEVRTAHDPAAGIAVAEAFAPEVAVLDIGLPGMDGWALGTTLRGCATIDPPACIAVTGYGMELDRARSEAAGFVAHLVKPVDVDRLERLLSGVLAARPGPARA